MRARATIVGVRKPEHWIYKPPTISSSLQFGAGCTPDVLLQRWIAEVNVFVGTTPQHDDITCTVIKAQ